MKDMNTDEIVAIEREIFTIGLNVDLTANAYRTMIYLASKMQNETQAALDLNELAKETNQTTKEAIQSLNRLRLKGIYSVDSIKKPKLITRNRVYNT